MLKSKFVVSLSLGIFSLLCTASAQAATLGLSPSSQNVLLNDQVEVELTISNLGSFSAPSLSTYDVDIAFNDSLLSFDSATFGDTMLGNQLDLFGFGSINGALPNAGSVNVFELSLDFPGVLDTFQADNFTLATLTFNSLSPGSSSLNITLNALGDSLGAPIADVSLQNATVNILANPTAIPEPSQILGTAMALGFGIGSLYFHSRKPRKDESVNSELNGTEIRRLQSLKHLV